MARYRIPYQIHKARKAKTKAHIHYSQTWDGVKAGYVPAANAKFIELEAPSHAAAMRELQKLILPDDPRLLQGRSQASILKHFIVT